MAPVPVTPDFGLLASAMLAFLFVTALGLWLAISSRRRDP